MDEPIEEQFAATDLGWMIVCEYCGGTGRDPDDVEPGPCVMCGGRGLIPEDEFYADERDGYE